MTTPKANNAENRVAEAYSWAAGLVGLMLGWALGAVNLHYALEMARRQNPVG